MISPTFERLSIHRITLQDTKRKPFYSRRYLNYYCMRTIGISTSAWTPIFKRAKLEGIDFGVHKYNYRMIEDTDIYMSDLHQWVLQSFYKELQYRTFMDLRTTEIVPISILDDRVLFQRWLEHVQVSQPISMQVQFPLGVTVIDTIDLQLRFSYTPIKSLLNEDEDDDDGNEPSFEFIMSNGRYTLEYDTTSSVHTVEEIVDAWVKHHGYQGWIPPINSLSEIDLDPTATIEGWHETLRKTLLEIHHVYPLHISLSYTKSVPLFTSTPSS